MQYIPKGRNIRVDSQLISGSPMVNAAGISFSGGFEQQNPVFIQDVIHVRNGTAASKFGLQITHAS